MSITSDIRASQADTRHFPAETRKRNFKEIFDPVVFWGIMVIPIVGCVLAYAGQCKSHIFPSPLLPASDCSHSLQEISA